MKYSTRDRVRCAYFYYADFIPLTTLSLIQLETGLYVTELKDHVIIQQEGEDQIYTEEDVLNMPAEQHVETEVDHLVVEAQVKIVGFSHRLLCESSNLIIEKG